MQSYVQINMICQCASNLSLRCSVLSFYVIKHPKQLKNKSKKIVHVSLLALPNPRIEFKNQDRVAIAFKSKQFFLGQKS